MRRVRARWLAVGVIAAALSMSSIPSMAYPRLLPAGDASVAEPGFDARQISRLEAALREGLAGRQGGAVAGVWVPGKGSWVGAVGVADLQTGRPMTTDMQAPIGSITKTFTGSLVMQEVQKGTIALTDPLAKWYPAIPKADEITVAMLLDMSSGIGDYLNVRLPELAQELLAQPKRRYAPEEMIAFGAALPRAFEVPGSAHSYSNTNTTILGRILEKVTGKSYADLVKSRLLGPLGLTRTQMNYSGQLKAPFTQTYSAQMVEPGQAPVRTTDWSASWGYAAGSLASTLDDLHTWGIALGTGKGVLNADTQRVRMNTCSPEFAIPNGDVGAYCLGVLVFRDAETRRIKVVWHNGAVIGAVSYVGYYPRTGAVVAVLVNTDDSSNGQAGSMQISSAIQESIPGLLGLL